MSENRLNAALARIEAGLSRIEKVRVVVSPSADVPLRAQGEATLAALDTLIATLRRDNQHG